MPQHHHHHRRHRRRRRWHVRMVVLAATYALSCRSVRSAWIQHHHHHHHQHCGLRLRHRVDLLHRPRSSSIGYPHGGRFERSSSSSSSSRSSSSSSRSRSSSSSRLYSATAPTIDDDDERFMKQAVECARRGFGHTFPNPAVGCVLVHQTTGQVLGRGFHPRAGYPHAEIFALLEAAGHVESGITAAQSVVVARGEALAVRKLAEQYAGGSGNEPKDDQHDHNDDDDDDDGPRSLFAGCLADVPVTAYVTLEPCCHYGRTPPCAQSLALAHVDRVVVGFRDPNPRVDGGGVQVLQEQGIVVDMVDPVNSGAGQECADLVTNFVKRIIPKDYDVEDYSHITGATRRALRTWAGRKKSDDTLIQVNWTSKSKASTEDEVHALPLEAEWMERLDATLWQEEYVNLRLNRAVSKKKLAKTLGKRIADALEAHVAQSVGHTVLLYRPGIPPVLDLEQLVASTQLDKEETNQDDES